MTTEQLNKSKENIDTEGRHSTHNSNIRRSLKEKNGKTRKYMATVLDVWIDSLLAKMTRSCDCKGEF